MSYNTFFENTETISLEVKQKLLPTLLSVASELSRASSSEIELLKIRKDKNRSKLVEMEEAFVQDCLFCTTKANEMLSHIEPLLAETELFMLIVTADPSLEIYNKKFYFSIDTNSSVYLPVVFAIDALKYKLLVIKGNQEVFGIHLKENSVFKIKEETDSSLFIRNGVCHDKL